METFTQNEQLKNGNKRYTPRWNIQDYCACQMSKGSLACEGHLKDVSCTGACVETDQNVPINQNINLTLHLPDRGVVNVCGKAVWARAVNSHHEIGIHFFNTSSKTQDTILQHAVGANKELLKDHWFKGWEEPSGKALIKKSIL